MEKRENGTVTQRENAKLGKPFGINSAAADGSVSGVVKSPGSVRKPGQGFQFARKFLLNTIPDAVSFCGSYTFLAGPQAYD